MVNNVFKTVGRVVNNKSNSTTRISSANSKKYQQQAHAYLKAELGMDDEQVTGILKTLSSPLKVTLRSVAAAYKKKNSEEIAETAHSLKGALLNLGLNELAELAKMIELSAATGKQISHERNLAHLHDALQQM